MTITHLTPKIRAVKVPNLIDKMCLAKLEIQLRVSDINPARSLRSA